MGIPVRDRKLCRRTTTSVTIVNMSVKTQVQLPSSPKMKNTKQRTARRVVKKYRSVRGGQKSAAADSYWRLKLVPTIKSKENISKLDVVLEAISYIQSLQCNLINQ